MENIILGIVFYVGWMFLKNFLSQKNVAKRSAQKTYAPPVVDQASRPFFNIEERYEEDDEQEFEAVESSYNVYAEGESAFVQSVPVESAKLYSEDKKQAQVERYVNQEVNLSEQEESDVLFDALHLSQQSLVNGIVMSEVLGKPRAIRSR
ncbi:MAG: hypothetical protein AB7G87_14685 [Clostridia bacterium]